MNNARIVLIALLMLQCLHSHAQKYSWYGAVTDSNRQVIYYTNFDKVDENNKDWEDPVEDAEDSVFYGYIKHETLEITNNSYTNVTATGFHLPIDFTRDFEIVFRARLDENYTKAALVFWGRDSLNEIYNGQYIYFYENSSYSMAYCVGYGAKPCDYKRTRLTYGSKNTRGDFNIYTIRKIEDMYYVFVNGEFSHRYAYTPIKGEWIGFGTSYRTQANMDYIKVSYLKLDYKKKNKHSSE